MSGGLAPEPCPPGSAQSIERDGQHLRKGVAGGLGNYVAMAASLGAGFLTSALLVRHLSTEEFGIYRLFVSIITVGALFLSLGVDKALMRYGAELFLNRNYRQYFSLLRLTMVARGAVLVLAGMAMIVFREAIAALLNMPPAAAGFLPVVGLALGAFSLNSLWGSALLATRMEQAKDSIGQVGSQLVLVLGVLVCMWMDLELSAVLSVWVASYLFALLYYTVVNLKWMSALERPAVSTEPAVRSEWPSKVFAFSAMSYLGLFLASFRDLTADNLFISYFLDPQQVAMYSLAASLVLLVSRLNPASVLRSVIMFMMISRQTQRPDPHALVNLHRSVNKLVIFVTLPLYATLVILGKEIIAYVFSPDYVSAYVSLVVLSCFFFVSGFELAFLPIIYTLEKLHMLLVGGSIGLGNVALNIVLIPQLGIVGAALATGSSGVVALAINWWYFKVRVRLDIRFPWTALIKATLNLLPAMILTWLVRPYIGGLFGLIAVLGMGAVTYLALCAVNKVFEQAERDAINSALGRRLLVF